MCVMLASCAPLQNGQDPTPLKPVTLVHIAALTYDSGAYTTETVDVARDATSWQNLWARLTMNTSPAPNIASVDFNKNMVIVAAAGQRPSGGYAISITDISGNSSVLTINVLVTSPGNGCVVPAIVTAPVDVATVPQSTASINFNFSHKVHNCA